MIETSFEHDAHEAVQASTVLTDDEKAAIDVAQLRTVECVHLTHALHAAEDAAHVIRKARTLAQAIMRGVVHSPG